MHLKRNEMPRTWPLKRKGTKYVACSISDLENSIPFVIALRDILELAETAKEAKRILISGKVKINGKTIREENFPLTLFDVLSLDEKCYKLILKNKKFHFLAVNEKEANHKIAKIIGKKMQKKNIIQLNLSDGRNYIIKEKASVGDSILTYFKDNKSEILPFKQGSKVIFISGKHLGEEGIVEKIQEDLVIVKSKENMNTKQESLMVIK